MEALSSGIKKDNFLEEKGINKGVNSDYQDNYLIIFSFHLSLKT